MAQEFDFDIGNVVGPPGGTGNGIKSIELLSTAGLAKTYRITMTDDTTFDFTVTDGNGITSASLDSTTYQLTLTFSNGTSYTTPSIRGAQGNDGVSPAVTVTTITGGHRVTITDKTHPTGQSFDVLDGEDGASDAGEVTYDDTETYPRGSVGNELTTLKTALSELDSDKITKPTNPASGAFLVWNGTAWVAQTLATWQGGNY